MSQTKFAASLAPTLLARKGGARPAMRPQFQRLTPMAVGCDEALQDLGWNDMGVTSHTPAGAVLVSRPPHQKHEQGSTARDDGLPETNVEDVDSQPFRQHAVTVRINLERHLQLRLASVVKNRSAQHLVRNALDRLLAAMSDERPSIALGERG
jgi:hypothetical protein